MAHPTSPRKAEKLSGEQPQDTAVPALHGLCDAPAPREGHGELGGSGGNGAETRGGRL